MIAATFWAAAAAGTPLISPELHDYLVQDVCVDARDHPLPGDPATCLRHRDIRAGEPSPYIMTDRSHRTGVTYEAQTSFPVRLADGTPGVMISRSLQGNFDPRFTFRFDASKNSYDLMDLVHSPYTSFIRTFDTGCHDQLWSHDGRARTFADRAGGWINFPRSPPSSWPLSSSTPLRTFHIQLPPAPPLPTCHDGSALGVSFWNQPRNYLFENGRSMAAIVSDHFGNADLADVNNALERYFFTRAYGNTRWEAWIPQRRCFAEKGADNPACHPERPDSYPLTEFCRVADPQGAGHPGLDHWGGQAWVRTACRDHTHYIPLDRPQIMLDADMARRAGHVDLR